MTYLLVAANYRPLLQVLQRAVQVLASVRVPFHVCDRTLDWRGILICATTFVPLPSPPASSGPFPLSPTIMSTAAHDTAPEEDAPISVPDSGDSGEGGKIKMIVQLVKKCLGVNDIAAM